MKQADLPAVTRVQAECYPPSMQEAEATIRTRLQFASDTAWVAEDESGVCAYLMGYRSVIGKVTPLNGLFDIPQSPDTIYLHDLAVSNRGRGRGIGAALVQTACLQAKAEGLPYSALVSVQGSQAFWQSAGYAGWHGLEPVELGHLRTYPGPASYMVRRLK